MQRLHPSESGGSALEALATAISNKDNHRALALLERAEREEVLKKVECQWGKQKQSCQNQHWGCEGLLEEVKFIILSFIIQYIFAIVAAALPALIAGHVILEILDHFISGTEIEFDFVLYDWQFGLFAFLLGSIFRQRHAHLKAFQAAALLGIIGATGLLGVVIGAYWEGGQIEFVIGLIIGALIIAGEMCHAKAVGCRRWTFISGSFLRCKLCGYQVCTMCNMEKDNGTLLHLAAYHGSSAAIITRLLAVGGQDLLDAKDSSGKTARHLASERGQNAVVSDIDRWAARQQQRLSIRKKHGR
jgi:hypothetical protein